MNKFAKGISDLVHGPLANVDVTYEEMSDTVHSMLVRAGAKNVKSRGISLPTDQWVSERLSVDSLLGSNKNHKIDQSEKLNWRCIGDTNPARLLESDKFLESQGFVDAETNVLFVYFVDRGVKNWSDLADFILDTFPKTESLFLSQNWSYDGEEETEKEQVDKFVDFVSRTQLKLFVFRDMQTLSFRSRTKFIERWHEAMPPNAEHIFFAAETLGYCPTCLHPSKLVKDGFPMDKTWQATNESGARLQVRATDRQERAHGCTCVDKRTERDDYDGFCPSDTSSDSE